MNFQLSLTEYSAKYKVSISTLRRRIKKNEVEHVQDSGKYMLPDVPFDILLQNDTAPHTLGEQSFGRVLAEERFVSENTAPPQEKRFDTEDGGAFLKPLGLNLSFSGAEDVNVQYVEEQEPVGDNGEVSSALVELKKAYTKVLSEKEAQLIQLKQHIADLQTLNKALENETERLSAETMHMPKTSFSKYDF